MRDVLVKYLLMLLGLGVLLSLLCLVAFLILDWPMAVPPVDLSVITGSACAPPCWQGIRPGAAMAEEEIITILRGFPSAFDIEARTRRPGGEREIVWFWKAWPWQFVGYNNSSVVLEDGIVRSITLGVPELEVQDVIEQYGLPEGMRIIDSTDRLDVAELFYPTRGVVFIRVKLSYGAEGPAIEPTSRTFAMTYIEPATSVEAWLRSEGYYVRLEPWMGYGKVDWPIP